jgi:hypothetical protein
MRSGLVARCPGRHPHRFDGVIETAERLLALGELAPELGQIENLVDIRMGDKRFERLDDPSMVTMTIRVAPFGLDSSRPSEPARSSAGSQSGSGGNARLLTVARSGGGVE